MSFKLFLKAGSFSARHYWPVLFLLGGYILLALFFWTTLQYNFLRSDVLSYWQESLSWWIPFNEHPPLYALTIALVRFITFNSLPPVLLMMGINLISFLACIFLTIQFLQAAGAGHKYAAMGALMFGLWPFVGITYTVMPLADIPAMVLTLAGFVLLLLMFEK